MRIYSTPILSFITDEEPVTLNDFMKKEDTEIRQVKAILLKFNDPVKGIQRMFHLDPAKIWPEMAKKFTHISVKCNFVSNPEIIFTDGTETVSTTLWIANTIIEGGEVDDIHHVSYMIRSINKLNEVISKKGVVAFKNTLRIAMITNIVTSSNGSNVGTTVEGQLVLNLSQYPHKGVIQATYASEMPAYGIVNSNTAIDYFIDAEAGTAYPLRMNMVNSYLGELKDKVNRKDAELPLVLIGNGLPNPAAKYKDRINKAIPLQFIDFSCLTQDELDMLSQHKNTKLVKVQPMRFKNVLDSFCLMKDCIILALESEDEDGEEVKKYCTHICMELCNRLMEQASIFDPISFSFKGDVTRSDFLVTASETDPKVVKHKPTTDGGEKIGEYMLSLMASNFTITLDYADADREVEQFNDGALRVVMQPKVYVDLNDVK